MKTMTVQAIATLLGGTFEGGPGETEIKGGASIAGAGPGDITFAGHPRYLNAVMNSKATAVLVPTEFNGELPAIRIKVANPAEAFAVVLKELAPPQPVYGPGIHPTAVIGENVTLAEDVSIQPYAVIESGTTIGRGGFVGAHSWIGQNVTIGENCRIYSNVSIREGAILGDRVTVHCGTVIGSDGFGYEFVAGRHQKIPQIGVVQIDNDVEIGANVAIDRARFGRTWIQEGTKIDNLCQIAHNVVIGKHCVVVSQVGISGSTKLGNYVTLAGQVGVVGHIEIGDQAVVGAQSGVTKSLRAKGMYCGMPAVPDRDFKERLAYTNRLEKLFERVKKLEQLLDSHGISSPPES